MFMFLIGIGASSELPLPLFLHQCCTTNYCPKIWCVSFMAASLLTWGSHPPATWVKISIWKTQILILYLLSFSLDLRHSSLFQSEGMLSTAFSPKYTHQQWKPELSRESKEILHNPINEIYIDMPRDSQPNINLSQLGVSHLMLVAISDHAS